jgi:hypothetical protein
VNDKISNGVITLNDNYFEKMYLEIRNKNFSLDSQNIIKECKNSAETLHNDILLEFYNLGITLSDINNCKIDHKEEHTKITLLSGYTYYNGGGINIIAKIEYMWKEDKFYLKELNTYSCNDQNEELTHRNKNLIFPFADYGDVLDCCFDTINGNTKWFYVRK